MLAIVTYPYRDRETFAVHMPGEQVELGDKRFAELSAGGFVEPAPCAAGDAAEPEQEPDAAPDSEPEPDAAAEPEGEAPGQADDGRTRAELRAEIESRGGHAPAKATKEQLAEMLRML